MQKNTGFIHQNKSIFALSYNWQIKLTAHFFDCFAARFYIVGNVANQPFFDEKGRALQFFLKLIIKVLIHFLHIDQASLAAQFRRLKTAK